MEQPIKNKINYYNTQTQEMHKQNNQENHFPDLNIFQGQEINEKYIIGNSIGSG
tara:strand:- start:692 stop:853 length:162 start_codon:yes stop_codon:yes gene_type:complete